MRMNLREFMSNNRSLMQTVPAQDPMMNTDKPVNFLGIKWDPKSDTLGVRVNIGAQEVSSKRTALRVFASTFDPLGLLTPLLVKDKTFIQDLWEAGRSWDEQLDTETVQKWNQIVAEIEHMT
ncbi:hypothetical protein OESDEN_23337 [Oesophagostomum dentatum]|uniref:Uncharacterized protein n=1 Tax=Oesophagostomum dentatum TaxID=61180 RepID=A0A0B1RVC3_OESDE|nr:hypothetical protein OESDEN_23337 [Oesophagostomum dentatum]